MFHLNKIKEKIAVYWSMLLYAVLIFSCGDKSEKIVNLAHQKADTIHFNLKDDHIYCEVRINKSKNEFVFDTGASNTTINDSTKGGTYLGKSFVSDYRKIKHTVDKVSFDSLILGNTLFYQFQAYNQVRLRGVEGILGGGNLKHLAWKINFSDQTIVFAEQAKYLKPQGKGIPFELKNNCPYIDAKIGNENLTFLLDFGFVGFMQINTSKSDVNPSLLQKTTQWRSQASYCSSFDFDLPGLIDTSYYHISTASIGQHLLKDEIIEFNPYINKNVIGMDFFQRFQYVILDYPGKKLYLGPPMFKSHRYLSSLIRHINTIGIEVTGTLVPKISSISENLMANNEILLGDTILDINGTSVFYRDSSFYQDIKSGSKRAFEYSIFSDLLNDLHFLTDTAVIKVKKGGSFREITLHRKYIYPQMPDTIQSYGRIFKPLITGSLGAKLNDPTSNLHLYFPYRAKGRLRALKRLRR
ncbi:hypothetical protein FNH22_21055 [Fulvivirga sp. M361]|uniref:hypothetical protein n=1 Tax=Fulvivirga sp. M361 TaxID=2594266 RepID=UPI00117BDAD0|nr:hypothetical protein [Fulvivirga sp. M361]TRX53386.1 hypothetical protein FNH22_21055 [Fulvivirga sp. M361]